MNEVRERIDAFLAGGPFAVAGASTDRSKFGNKILRCYLNNGREALPVNPKEDRVEGLECYPDLAALPADVHGLSIVTPPAVTEALVESAIEKGITHLWIQPGAESPEAIERARSAGLSVIAGGPCLLVELGF